MKVRVRLRKTHYHNSVRKVAGNVLRLGEWAAQQLVDQKVADYVKKPK